MRGIYKVLRGGSWFNSPWNLRSANRNWNTTDTLINYGGFRLARTNTSEEDNK